MSDAAPSEPNDRPPAQPVTIGDEAAATWAALLLDMAATDASQESERAA